MLRDKVITFGCHWVCFAPTVCHATATTPPMMSREGLKSRSIWSRPIRLLRGTLPAMVLVRSKPPRRSGKL